MADIANKIWEKYKIDIKTNNPIILYKIKDPDISASELDIILAERKKNWERSANGTKETVVEKAKAHLANVSAYEGILRNTKIRQELFTYTNKSVGNSEVLEFAREYFQLIRTTKKIRKAEVNFFFDYFTEMKKYRKDINEMLKKEFKLSFLNANGTNQQDEEKEVIGKKKGDSVLIANLFQEATIINLRKCEKNIETAALSEKICMKFPDIKVSMAKYLQIDQYKTVEELKNVIEKQRKYIYDLKQENGSVYAPLLDFFNTFAEIVQYTDVVDNYEEFKLLIKYSKLTPYMYVFEDVKVKTIKDFFNLAKKYYGFRDIYDFILTYYKPIYDNFGIYDQSIKSILKEAEKRAGQKKVLDKIDQILGICKEKQMSFGVKLVHFLTYWPIYILFGIFELTKFTINKLRYIALISFVPMFIAMLQKAPALYGVDFFALKDIVSKDKWCVFLDGFIGLQTGVMFEVITTSFLAIILLLVFYIFPPVIVTIFLWISTVILTKHYDWKGMERTLK